MKILYITLLNHMKFTVFGFNWFLLLYNKYNDVPILFVITVRVKICSHYKCKNFWIERVWKSETVCVILVLREHLQLTISCTFANHMQTETVSNIGQVHYGNTHVNNEMSHRLNRGLIGEFLINFFTSAVEESWNFYIFQRALQNWILKTYVNIITYIRQIKNKANLRCLRYFTIFQNSYTFKISNLMHNINIEII